MIDGWADGWMDDDLAHLPNLVLEPEVLTWVLFVTEVGCVKVTGCSTPVILLSCEDLTKCHQHVSPYLSAWTKTAGSFGSYCPLLLLHWLGSRWSLRLQSLMYIHPWPFIHKCWSIGSAVIHLCVVSSIPLCVEVSFLEAEVSQPQWMRQTSTSHPELYAG